MAIFVIDSLADWFFVLTSILIQSREIAIYLITSYLVSLFYFCRFCTIPATLSSCFLTLKVIAHKFAINIIIYWQDHGIPYVCVTFGILKFHDIYLIHVQLGLLMYSYQNHTLPEKNFIVNLPYKVKFIRIIQETRVNFVCLSAVLEPNNFPFFLSRT